MPLQRRGWVTEEMMLAEPDTLFVFGDNLEEWGRGGQAKVMRGKPNAVGLPTKRAPYKFLTDDDLPEVAAVVVPKAKRLFRHLMTGGLVVWPLAGIGTGLADLRRRAPKIAEFYDELLDKCAFNPKED